MSDDNTKDQDNSSDFSTISNKRLKHLEWCERWVQALEAAGVDNWDGYDYAQELMEDS